jgi:hypothetical protein
MQTAFEARDLDVKETAQSEGTNGRRRSPAKPHIESLAVSLKKIEAKCISIAS